jgi:hypothetical protein
MINNNKEYMFIKKIMFHRVYIFLLLKYSYLAFDDCLPLN